MFGQNENANSEATSAPSDMLTMDTLFGESVSDAKLLESKLYPAGFYLMSLSDYEEKTYEIKKEDHPNVGTEALQINLKFTIDAIDDSGSTEYVFLDKKGKWKKASLEEVSKYVGEEITFTVFFGDDQLIGDDGKPKLRGRNQLRTILHKFVGPDNAAADGYDLDSATFGQLFETAKKVNCIVPMTNRPDFRDKTRIQAEIDLLSDFLPQANEAA